MGGVSSGPLFNGPLFNSPTKSRIGQTPVRLFGTMDRVGYPSLFSFRICIIWRFFWIIRMSSYMSSKAPLIAFS